MVPCALWLTNDTTARKIKVKSHFLKDLNFKSNHHSENAKLMNGRWLWLVLITSSDSVETILYK